MKNVWSLSAVTLVMVTLLFFAPTPHTSAHARFSPTDPGQCSDTWYQESETDAYGSTSAYVSFSLWKQCSTGRFFASIHSFADAHGWAFHGTLYLKTDHGGFASVNDTHGAGIYDTPALSMQGDAFSTISFVSNGGFYSCWACTNLLPSHTAISHAYDVYFLNY